MRLNRWQMSLAGTLIILSVGLYIFHYTLFRDSYHIFIYMVGDIAFVPIEVLLVTVIIHQLLSRREKKTILNKLNMLVGVFYSEIGTSVVNYILRHDGNAEGLRSEFVAAKDWSYQELAALASQLKSYEPMIEMSEEEFEKLAAQLKSKRLFLIQLLQNPVLLEQETFSDLLRKLFHVEEEFSKRMDVRNLSETDHAHLITDINKAYKALLLGWIEYMHYLKDKYPGLFIFAMETNPFTLDPATKTLAQPSV